MRIFCAFLLAAFGAASLDLAQAATEQPLLREPSISSKEVVFTGRGHLWIAPRSGGMARRLTEGDYSEHDPVFSPDGKYVAFTREGYIYVIPAAGGAPRRLTWHPSGASIEGWTPDGKYILFQSNRLFRVAFEGGMEEPLPMPVAGFASYSPDGRHIVYSPIPEMAIYMGRNRYRGGATAFLALYEPATNHFEEFTHSDANDMYPMWHGDSIYFASDRSGTVNLYRYDLATRVTQALTSDHDFDLREPSLGPDAIVYLTAGRLRTYDLATGRIQDLHITLPPSSVTAEQRALWTRVFDGAWKTYRDHAAFPVSDWSAIRAKYEPLLPRVEDRRDLQFIITEMLAETGQSHISVQAPPRSASAPVIPAAGLLGADYTVENRMYRFSRIYKGPESPLAAVADGEYLLAVNDHPLRSPADLFAAFEGTAGKAVRITVNAQPTETGSRQITVTPIQKEQALRYSAWVEDRYRRVREAGGDRIAYIHVPEIEPPGADSFRKQLDRQSGAEALILDVRNNNGGTMTDFFLDFLSRVKERNLIHRGPAMKVSFPEFAVSGPKVMLVNEQSDSGAEELAYLAQRRKVATIVGARTNGALIGSGSDYHLEDGTVGFIPEFAMYTLDDGKWYPEGKGVLPDYAVNQRADLVASGQDPQLEKAIEVALEELKQLPMPPEPIPPVD